VDRNQPRLETGVSNACVSMSTILTSSPANQMVSPSVQCGAPAQGIGAPKQRGRLSKDAIIQKDAPRGGPLPGASDVSNPQIPRSSLRAP
jgi:hypothetical protein